MFNPARCSDALFIRLIVQQINKAKARGQTKH